MPNSITINGATYQALENAFAGGTSNPTAGIYYAHEIAPPPFRSGAAYREMKGGFPGIDGQFTKRFGFENRKLAVILCLIGTNKAGIDAHLSTLDTLVTQLARYTITMPGGTAFQGCKIEQGGMMSLAESNFGNRICNVLGLRFEQLSDTN